MNIDTTQALTLSGTILRVFAVVDKNTLLKEIRKLSVDETI